MAGCIRIANRIISTICKHVIPYQALISACVAICIDKPAGVGVIVAGLQVVEAGLAVVVVATIPQWVDFRHGAGSGQDFAIGIIRVCRYLVAIAIDQVHHIPLEVGDVVVGSGGGTVVVNQGIGIPYVVIPEVQGLCGTALPQQHAAGIDIAVFLCHRADGLRRVSAAVGFFSRGHQRRRVGGGPWNGVAVFGMDGDILDNGIRIPPFFMLFFFLLLLCPFTA